MKGTISEMEVASFRERAQAAILQKAQRGALVRRVPIGYIKGTEGRIEKDPDTRIRAAIDLIFHKFAEMGSVTHRCSSGWIGSRFQLPIARGPEETQEIVWRPARYHAVLLRKPAKPQPIYQISNLGSQIPTFPNSSSEATSCAPVVKLRGTRVRRASPSRTLSPATSHRFSGNR